MKSPIDRLDPRRADRATWTRSSHSMPGSPHETEGKTLDRAVLTRGVTLAIADPGRLRYWVATLDGRPVGQVAVTREWSDWRCGWVWWFQSVYVEPERAAGAYFGLSTLGFETRPSPIPPSSAFDSTSRPRTRAQQTYRALGMVPGGYLVYEELWQERFHPPSGSS